MRRAGTSFASHVPVVVAALLIATSLTGARLYASSAGSAALAQQRSETCEDESALTLPILLEPPDSDVKVRRIGDAVPMLSEPVRGAVGRPEMLTASGLPRRLTLVNLDDADQHVTPPLAPLGPNEVAVSASNLSELALQVGDTIEFKHGSAVTITQTFDDVPFAPIPDYWCGFPELFEPTNSGDLPPPFAIASFDTVVGHNERLSVFDRYRVIPEEITLTEAHQVERGFEQAVADFENTVPGVSPPRNEWSRVVQRAASVHTTVQRNLAPVVLIALLADLMVLVAAAVLVARERRRELRLLAVRGVHPVKVAGYVAPGLAISVVVGSLAGFALAWSAVALFGPSSLLEPGAIVGAAVSVAVAALVATAVVAAVVALVADRSVDGRPARVATHVPFVVATIGLVVLAVVSFRRLDELGGVRTSGVLSSGGDLLAMGFPLFGLLAAISVAGALVVMITPRLRLTGARWRRAVRLGWRRVVLEATPLAAVVMSVALAAGCFTLAFALFGGAEQQLRDKATVYVGSDLSVVLFGESEVPDEWAGRTSLTSRVRAQSDGDGLDIAGIDPSTFTDAAVMRSDGSTRSLDDLVSLIDVDPASGSGAEGIAAVAVGADLSEGDTIDVTAPGTTEPITLRVVATATFFPTKGSGSPLFVVRRDLLDDAVPFPSTVLLVRDPPDDALQQLRDQGARMGLVRDADQAFDGSSYSALRWSYVPLAALGLLFVAVALALQLLVVSARRDQRRIAHALMVRSGFDRRASWTAAVVEVGVPLAVGTVVGVLVALVTSSLSIGRLDPMPTLAPPAEFLMPWTAVLGAVVVLPIWTVVIGWSVVRSTERGDPMRVFQGAA
ncbi:MAG: hypothetical protein HY828_16580 [Actinobacteria bacterium]|nr:hypothetical protein [Actinomycetota bacterium]